MASAAIAFWGRENIYTIPMYSLVGGKVLVVGGWSLPNWFKRIAWWLSGKSYKEGDLAE